MDKRLRYFFGSIVLIPVMFALACMMIALGFTLPIMAIVKPEIFERNEDSE